MEDSSSPNTRESILDRLKNRPSVHKYRNQAAEESFEAADPLSNPEAFSFENVNVPLNDQAAHEETKEIPVNEDRGTYQSPALPDQIIQSGSAEAAAPAAAAPAQVAPDYEQARIQFPEDQEEVPEPRPQIIRELMEEDIMEPPFNNAVLPTDYLSMNRQSIFFLFTGIAWLLFCCETFRSTNEYVNVLPENPTPREFALFGNGTCDMDSNSIMKTVIYTSLIPTLILRLIAHFYYMGRDPLDFKNTSQRIYVYFHCTYGIWTLYHLMAFMSVNINCKNLMVFNMINFEAVLIIGCFSAVHVMFVIIVIVIILPMYLYGEFKRYQHRNQHLRRTKQMLNSLVCKQYEVARFQNVNECAICLDYFDENKKCMVTPLPCNTKHIFHEQCIKEWFMKQNKCPLCKTDITESDCKKQLENFENLFPRQSSEIMEERSNKQNLIPIS